MEYLISSFLGGSACKIYDDFNDNPNFLNFKKKHELMEFLKGIHYITFTAVSINDPMFFIINYVANFGHHLTNKYAFADPYEHSLLFSFLVVLLFIKFKKLQSFKKLDIYVFVIITISIIIEPFIVKPVLEVSVEKLLMRFLAIFNILIFLLLDISPSVRFLLLYALGYLLFSVISQYYSLYHIE
jgi:hypothetical protein